MSKDDSRICRDIINNLKRQKCEINKMLEFRNFRGDKKNNLK